MDEVGPVGGGEPAEHAVQSDNDGDQGHKHVFGLHPKQFRSHQRHGDFSDGGEEHRAIYHIIKAAEDCVGDAHGFGFVALGEPVAKGEAAHAAVPHGADPVDGRDEEPIHHAPHSAHPIGEGAAGGVNRVGGTGARAKGGKGLHQLAEFAAAHKIILLPFDLPHGPKADTSHSGEIKKENEIIREIHHAKDTDLRG